MTGPEIKTAVEALVHDTINETLFYELLNTAKTRWESSRKWLFLRTEDSTKTASSGDTFETAKALPDRFLNAVGMNVGAVYNPYKQIAFDKKYLFKDQLNRFYIDHKNSNFYLTGRVNESKAIHLFFTQGTVDISSSQDPTWPDRFHYLLVWDVALLFVDAVDVDDINALLGAGQARARVAMQKAMIDWDSGLQLDAQDMSRPNDDELGDYSYPLGQM